MITLHSFTAFLPAEDIFDDFIVCYGVVEVRVRTFQLSRCRCSSPSSASCDEAVLECKSSFQRHTMDPDVLPKQNRMPCPLFDDQGVTDYQVL